MPSMKVRPDLEELRARLVRHAREVPPQATRFHDLRSDLEQQVASLLARWVLRLGDAGLASLRAQVDRLGELAPALARLIRRCEETEKEVLGLRAIAEASDDRELPRWLVGRCVEWQSALRRLGSNVGRPIELEQDQLVLERTEERVRCHAQALQPLAEARQLLARLGDRMAMETAALRADLPLLRERLFAEGASAAWLAEIERALGPLRAVADLPPPQPPRDLAEVRRLLPGARRWIRVLDTGEEEALVLQVQASLAEAEGGTSTDEEVRLLLDQVSALVRGLSRTAAERRGEALALLGKRYRQLTASCGQVPALERELADLAAAEAAAPETYAAWMERQAEVERLLVSTASAHLVDLQDWILRRGRELKDALDVLARQPLSAERASAAERLRLDLGGLPDPYDQRVGGIFESLEACDRIRLALDDLVEQARAERATLVAARRDLQARHQALREEVTRCGIEVADLGARIDALAETGSGRTLDDLRRDAAQLELELRALEQELVARCRAWISERFVALERRAAVLRRSGRPAGELPQQLTAGVPPAQAAAAVATLREVESELTRRLVEAQLELEARGGDLLERLQEVLERSLRPEVRRAAVEQAAWLTARSWEGAAEPDERIRRLLDGLEHSEALLAKLSQQERECRARAESLRRRLGQFNERDLDSFCPEPLVKRASALVAAIPAEPTAWADLVDQLDTAEKLIDRLEDHGLRRLAARLERAASDLERQIPGTSDREYAHRLRTLLDELAACDPRQPVPPALAAQVLLLAPDYPAGGDE